MEVLLKGGPFHVGAYYRPPSSSNSLTDLEDCLLSISPNQLKSSVFVGDFSINLLSDSPLSSEILSTMLGFHLHQVVSDPTRVSMSNSNSIRSSSLIDHVYMFLICLILFPAVPSLQLVTDHLCISTVLSKQVRPHKPICRRVWLYNKLS